MLNVQMESCLTLVKLKPGGYNMMNLVLYLMVNRGLWSQLRPATGLTWDQRVCCVLLRVMTPPRRRHSYCTCHLIPPLCNR